MTLYTLRYNNYYNRIKKGFDTVAEYQPFEVETFEDINFNPNDDINTNQILNLTDVHIDYLLVVNTDNEIVSRWYVMEVVRTRGGQYNVSLLRDVIMDYRSVVFNSPMMIRRGWTYNGDPAIFNNESIAVSQIKKSEKLLKDSSNTAWLVGYMANPKPEDADITIDYGFAEPEADINVTSLSNWEYNQYAYVPEKGQAKPDGFSYTEISSYSFLLSNGGTISAGTTKLNFNEDGYIEGIATGGNAYWYVDTMTEVGNIRDAIQATSRTELTNEIYEYYDDAAQSAKMANIRALKNKIIYVHDEDTYYQISLETHWGASDKVVSFKPEDANDKVVAAFDKFIEEVNINAGEIMTARTSYDDVDNYFVNFGDTYTRIIELTKVSTTSDTKNFTIPKTVRTLTDSPYRMFCMPYANNYKIKLGDDTFSTSELNTLSVATAIMINAGANVYDLQLLPYCPIGKLRANSMSCILDNWIEDVDYVFIEEVPTIMFFAETSKGTFNIPLEQDGPTVGNTIETKANCLTKFSRLCSPNYQGVFEYSPIKNYGVTKINVDFHYKPYQPYIHLNPDFYTRGLYGSDFNDARGLICGGDFSITRIDSAFTSYELQNKNYNTIFDKGIQKLETEQKYARQQEIFNAVTGSFQGAVSGAMTGGMMAGGHPAGFIAGGVAGAATSAIGGAYDVFVNDQLRQLNKQHTIDTWELSLDNIKAVPYSLSKVSAFNNNNKIWPFIEYYESTYEEYQAVYSYIEYRGMRLDRIGKINNMLPYIPTSLDYGFIQGDLIRLEGLNEDTHIATVISNELQQGVYI